MMKTFCKILSFILCLSLIVCIGLSGVSAVDNNEYLYEDVFVDYLRPYAEGHDEELGWYTYKELYYYYGDNKSLSVTPDETATPDYILVDAKVNMGGPMPCFKLIGDYVVESDMHYVPYNIGYHIYIPSSDKIYTLESSFANSIDGIEKVFTETGIGHRVGDTDNNGKLTIKDATEIQKALAGLTDFKCNMFVTEYPLGVIYDFNTDGTHSIKDATAIQKHIAGLEY